MTPAADPLAALVDHPDYAVAMQHTPPRAIGGVAAIGGLLVPAGISVGLAFGHVTGALIALAGASLVGARWYVGRAPLERFAARIVDPRGDGKPSVPVRAYVVVERLGQGPREFRAADHLHALAPGEIGIAYTRLGFLLDFRKLG